MCAPTPPAGIKQLLGKDVEVVDTLDGKNYTVPVAETHPVDTSHLVDNDNIAGMNNMVSRRSKKL